MNQHHPFQQKEWTFWCILVVILLWLTVAFSGCKTMASFNQPAEPESQPTLSKYVLVAYDNIFELPADEFKAQLMAHLKEKNLKPVDIKYEWRELIDRTYLKRAWLYFEREK